jgi:hypothetical protein
MTDHELSTWAGIVGPERFDSLNYSAMRLHWCRAALLAFLRRWAVYFVVAAAVLGAGAGGFVPVLMAASAWVVLPLFYSASQGVWLLPATAAQAALGAGLVWALRAGLWPVSWADAERALPIAPGQRLRSDAAVVALALAPLWLLYGAGAASLLGQPSAWLQPVRWRALTALLAAALGSVALGVGLLAVMRLAPRQSSTPGRVLAPPRETALCLARTLNSPRLHWTWALLLMPLWRGPARRTGTALALAGVGLGLPALGLVVWPAGASWGLAAYALLALLAVTRAHALAGAEFAALRAACAPLPLAPSGLPRAASLLCLLPLLPGALLLTAALPKAGMRLPVLLAYFAACAASALIEVFSAPAEAADKASRWLFSLVLCLALASEVMR